MNTDLLIILVIAVLFLIFGVLILLGRGDWLISGYNTASKQKKEKYNLPRLRLVTSLTSICVAFISVVGYYVDDEAFMTCTVLPIAIIAVIHSNTWAKRK